MKHKYNETRNIFTLTHSLKDFANDLSALSNSIDRTLKAIDRDDADLEEYLQGLKHKCRLINGTYLKRK